MSEVGKTSYIDLKDPNIYKSSQSNTTKNDLDKDAFLQLLVTQMRYQDPLNPTTDQQFLAQMAQFTALEQMQNLNKTNEISQAYALIGKTVQGSIVNQATLATEYIEGKVEGVIIKQGVPHVVVGDKELSLGRIEVVVDIPQPDVTRIDPFEVVGRVIRGIVQTADGQEEWIGKVEAIHLKNETPYALVGGKEIAYDKILVVDDTNGLLGKRVKAAVTDEEGTEMLIEGIVSIIKYRGDEVIVVVDGQEVPFNKIQVIERT